MTGVRIRKHVKTQTWRGGSMKMEPECGRMIYKTGHQGAGRRPWTLSLLGALERAWPCPHLDFRLPASRTARGYICAWSLWPCVTAAPGSKDKPVSRSLWFGKVTSAKGVCPSPLLFLLSMVGRGARWTELKEPPGMMNGSRPHEGRGVSLGEAPRQPRWPGTARSHVAWKSAPTLLMPLSFGVSCYLLLHLILTHPGRQICKWKDAVQCGK